MRTDLLPPPLAASDPPDGFYCSRSILGVEGWPGYLFQLVGRVQAPGPGPCQCSLSTSCSRDLADGRDTVRPRLRVRAHFKRYDYDHPLLHVFTHCFAYFIHRCTYLNTTTHAQVSFICFHDFLPYLYERGGEPSEGIQYMIAEPVKKTNMGVTSYKGSGTVCAVLTVYGSRHPAPLFSWCELRSELSMTSAIFSDLLK